MAWLESCLNHLAEFSAAAMMFMVAAEVIGRYAFRHTLEGVGVFDMTQFMMVGITYLALAHTQALKAHISVDLVLSRLPPRGRLITETVGYVLALIFFAVVVWQTWNRMAWSWQVGEATVGVERFPVWPARLIVPVGSFMLCLRFIGDIIQNLSRLVKSKGRES